MHERRADMRRTSHNHKAADDRSGRNGAATVPAAAARRPTADETADPPFVNDTHASDTKETHQHGQTHSASSASSPRRRRRPFGLNATLSPSSPFSHPGGARSSPTGATAFHRFSPPFDRPRWAPRAGQRPTERLSLNDLLPKRSGQLKSSPSRLRNVLGDQSRTAARHSPTRTRGHLAAKLVR